MAGIAIGRYRNAHRAPSKKQKKHYSGKKKRHTCKAQLVMQTGSRRLLVTTFGKGKIHDFALFKKSRLPLQPETCCLGDSGYRR